ncbi:unnamed protein product [Thelazia callipaeda]|uniref:WSD domain-containing protein n=1 Tax=Thelazia callipaeda TaxID=103827 RepID=A0A158RCU4_THECL|nr:unnamed protein product [Thelazia callipaeda]
MGSKQKEIENEQKVRIKRFAKLWARTEAMDSETMQKEERKYEHDVKEAETQVIKTLKFFHYELESNVQPDIMALIFRKRRWSENEFRPTPTWIKNYNSFARIDGPGFNNMRRDARFLISTGYANLQELMRGFPYPKKKTGVKTRAHKPKSSHKKDESNDESSEDESTKYSAIVPPLLFFEIRNDLYRRSAAAAIALQLLCSIPSMETLSRIILFEKCQVITEWEIAKKTYAAHGMDWTKSEGMKQLCTEVAAELIALDEATDAINAIFRYESLQKLSIPLKMFIESEGVGSNLEELREELDKFMENAKPHGASIVTSVIEKVQNVMEVDASTSTTESERKAEEKLGSSAIESLKDMYPTRPDLQKAVENLILTFVDLLRVFDLLERIYEKLEPLSLEDIANVKYLERTDLRLQIHAIPVISKLSLSPAQFLNEFTNEVSRTMIQLYEMLKTYVSFQYIATEVIKHYSDALLEMKIDESEIREAVVEILVNNLLISKKNGTFINKDFDDTFVLELTSFARTNLLKLLYERYAKKLKFNPEELLKRVQNASRNRIAIVTATDNNSSEKKSYSRVNQNDNQARKDGTDKKTNPKPGFKIQQIQHVPDEVVKKLGTARLRCALKLLKYRKEKLLGKSYSVNSDSTAPCIDEAQNTRNNNDENCDNSSDSGSITDYECSICAAENNRLKQRKKYRKK